MADLEALKSFAVANATVTLWVFRKRSIKDASPTYTGRWAELGDDLSSEMREVLSREILQIEELVEYGLLAQNNEGSVLTIPLIETHADILQLSASAEESSKKVSQERHLLNISFYAIKFSCGDVSVLGVRKADASWRTKKRSGVISFLFNGLTLVKDDRPSFNLSKSFDFLLFEDDIYIKQKREFESILEYKAAHQDEFALLCKDVEFIGAFVDLNDLKKFVGDDKIHLRRMAAIHEKKHYKDPAFMRRLRTEYASAGLNIVFDSKGKIIPSEETFKDIFQALLDFRLRSMFSENLYDVPDTSAV